MKKKIKISIDQKIETKKLKLLVSIMTTEWWVEDGLYSFRKWVRKNFTRFVEVK